MLNLDKTGLRYLNPLKNRNEAREEIVTYSTPQCKPKLNTELDDMNIGRR